MKPPLPLVVAGAAGRMGRELVRTIQETPGVRLEAATELPGHASLGRDAGRLAGLDELGVPVRESLSAVLRPGRVLMDFTLATATEGHLAACIEAGTALVLGTTGHDDRQRQLITDAARRIPLMFAPNMSIGVNVCLKLLEAAAAMFGEEADVEILEMHHRDKLDAPSGTALEMGRVLAGALGRDLAQDGVFARRGRTGARAPRSIGFQSLRGGDVAGEHTVIFAAPGERVEITHKASSRANFARGALRAAAFLASRRPGLYDMRDLLGLKD